MNKQEKELIDTYEAMSKEEKSELMLIKKIRQNIKFFVGIDNILEEIKNIIDNSEYFSFVNDRSRKYISKSKPLFIIKPNLEKLSENHKFIYKDCDPKEYFINGRTNEKFIDDVNYLQKMTHENIVRPYSEYLMTFLKDNDKFNEILKRNGLDEITIDKKTIDLISMTSVTMFSIKVDMAGDKIYLEYAI